MNREVLVGVVGVPTSVSRDFDPKFARLSAQVRVHHVLTIPMAPTEPYDADLAEDVFRRLADKLRKRDTRSHDLLSDTNVVLLYMNKRGSSALLKSLGMETLPMAWYPPGDLPGTHRERRRYVNGLIDDARIAIRHAKDLLGVIKQEVTNRDRKTCLLLPPKNLWPPHGPCDRSRPRGSATKECCPELCRRHQAAETRSAGWLLRRRRGNRVQGAAKGSCATRTCTSMGDSSPGPLRRSRTTALRRFLRSALSLRL